MWLAALRPSGLSDSGDHGTDLLQVALAAEDQPPPTRGARP